MEQLNMNFNPVTVLVFYDQEYWFGSADRIIKQYHGPNTMVFHANVNKLIGDRPDRQFLEELAGYIKNHRIDFFYIILHTTCYLCHSPIDHRFSLGSRIPAQPQWLEETVHCRKCNAYQKKKIRFYAKDDREGLPYNRHDPMNYVTEYDHCISAKERQVEDCVGCPYRGKCEKEVDYHGNT